MIRSALFTPGNMPKMHAKLASTEADAIILDIEDAVPDKQKETARDMVREALTIPKGPKRYVRVNGFSTGLIEGDLKAVVCADLDGIVLPKFGSVRELHELDQMISGLEQKAGLELGRIGILPSFESARSIMDAYSILNERPKRVFYVGLSVGDLMRDLGVRFLARWRMINDLNLLYPRSQLVFASQATGRYPVLDGVYGDIRNLEGLEEEANAARLLGLKGKKAVHPDQIAVINKVFTPTQEEIDYAQKIVKTFKAAEAEDSAAYTLDGSLVDIAVLKYAQAILEKFGHSQSLKKV